MQRLIYVMDPMCSWCWGFAPVVKALAAQAQAQQVPLHIVVGGLRLDRTPLEPGLREQVLKHWRAVAQTTKQPFTWDDALPPGFVYDTSLACQALVAARSLAPERALEYASTLQYAFYCEQAPLNNPVALVQLAQRVGFDAEIFAQRLDQAINEQDTLADFAWAKGLGIEGFPTLLAQRQGQLALLTNGYQPFDVLSPLLARWLTQACRV